jgi:type VI secretion system protein VasJ
VANLAEIAKLGTTPIPGDSPTGASARYEPDYEKVQLEIEKLQSVNQTPVRWDDVISLGTSLLSQKSKDLLIASYLATGLLSEHGYSGLAAGMGFYKDFLTTFWEKLFPPIEKMRGRDAAVRWFDERAARMVSEMPQSAEPDREPLTACLAALEALNGVLAEKFTEQALSMSNLAEKLQEKLDTIPAPQAAPVVEASAPAADGSVAPVQAAAYAPPPPQEIDSPERVREAVLKGVDYLKRSNAADPLAYQLERALYWGAVAELPEPMPAGGDATLIPAWETALRKKEYQRVLDETEARLPTDPLWLDLNLFGCRAMEGLGASFDSARQAVGAQVAALVRRIPDLTKSAFEGGVPVASEVARQWIDHELLGGVPKGAAGGAGPDRLEETMQEARKLATRGKLPAATAMIQKELQAVPPGRARFLWRLGLARLCADSGRAALAVPQLEALDGEAERGALEQWEPELAVEVVKLLWQCYSSLSKSGEGMAEKAGRAYARLCRLDLTTAMALDGKK